MLMRFLFCFLFLLQISWANQVEEFESAYQNTDNSRKKINILFSWSDYYAQKGDFARSMNKMEIARSLLRDVESVELIEKTEKKFWSVFKQWNTVSPERIKEAEQRQLIFQKKEDEKRKSRERLFPKKKSRIKKQIESVKVFVKGKRPTERRMLQPLSMGHLNGFNTMLSIPELSSAFLIPSKSKWMHDFKIDFGSYKEQNTSGLQKLDVDTTITRALYEITLPYSTIFRTKRTRPIDFRLGIPFVNWGTAPYFTADELDPSKTLLNGESTGMALGDIYIDGKVTLFSNFYYAIATSVRLKLPTGSTKKLTGTGSTDLAWSFLYSRAKLRHRWNTNLGFMITGTADNFENTSPVDLKDILFFSADYSYNVWGKHYVITGFDFHQNAFEGYTNLPVLDDPPTSVGVGLALNFKSVRYYFGLKRGLNGASADNQILLSYRMNY